MTRRQEPWWWTSYFCVSSGVFQENSAVFLQYSWIQCMEGEPAKPQILENKILQRFVTNPCVVVKRTSKQHIMHMAIVIVIVSILFCCNLYHLFFSFVAIAHLGLGTSTSQEAKEYFSDMQRHRIPFKYSGPQDDEAITLVRCYPSVWIIPWPIYIWSGLFKHPVGHN